MIDKSQLEAAYETDVYLKELESEYPADLLRPCSVLESGFFFLVSLAGSQPKTVDLVHYSAFHCAYPTVRRINLRSCLEALTSLKNSKGFGRPDYSWLALSRCQANKNNWKTI